MVTELVNTKFSGNEIGVHEVDFPKIPSLRAETHLS